MSNEDLLTQQTLCLASILQACDHIREIAYQGKPDSDYIAKIIEHLQDGDAESIKDFYPHNRQLRSGLELLITYLTQDQLGNMDRDLLHYLTSIISVQKSLEKNGDVRQELIKKMQELESDKAFFEDDSSAIINKVGGIYQNTISHLQPRIMIRGEQEHLNNSLNAARIRTLLLASLRYVVLWKQAGGSSWKLLFVRGKMKNIAQDLLQHH